MTHRFPYDEKEHAASKQTIQDALSVMHQNDIPFQWIEEDGSSLLGCYASLSYNPAFVGQFFEMAKTLYAPGTVKPRNRELAILGLSSVLDVPYVDYCHRKIGSKCGLSHEQFEDALAGKVPADLSAEEAMAYRLGRILTDLKTPLDDATWKEAVSVMGKSELVGIAHTVAGYRWVSLLDQINGDTKRWINKDE
ncbi:hypothetical protein CBS147343_4982 [Aspergillus niger]|uniref:Carboxymuconolactone decarboxylase-like domain-containing protein n=1 Tax=Aspergillus niger TaxID=5061 RepID=A0A9W5ZTM2_ASPNG|nr:hypothetical protein CBS133816_1663 [Aspergillus niger]KAI2914755.1 hypothetical protein CBS147320_10198 [Aspergillus niger]KAI2921523.1 hypothetical protein CBS147371_2779 [Aspergillus niger]KAI2945882.1 hypothetical protein CBS147321_3707 [Aspergillus niger]KAI2981752.1 hypothetical protein CBS147344_9282 [Aspergillus niger]